MGCRWLITSTPWQWAGLVGLIDSADNAEMSPKALWTSCPSYPLHAIQTNWQHENGSRGSMPNPTPPPPQSPTMLFKLINCTETLGSNNALPDSSHLVNWMLHTLWGDLLVLCASQSDGKIRDKNLWFWRCGTVALEYSRSCCHKA